MNGREQSRGDQANRNTGGAAEKGEQKAFGEQLPDQPAARCAQGGPDSHLRLARGGANEQKVGDVHARQQQDQDAQREKQGGSTHKRVRPCTAHRAGWTQRHRAHAVASWAADSARATACRRRLELV